MLNFFKKIFAYLFVPHTWDEQGDIRECACCGQVEVIGEDGLGGEVWCFLKPGDITKHMQ